MSLVHALHTRPSATETLLCLHSSGSSGGQWAALTPALETRFGVRTPELIGYGAGRRWPTGAAASLDAEAAALAPLLAVAPVHLFGHSYGGAVALQIALRWPERVRSLTLYEPVRFALLSGERSLAPVAESIVAIGRRIGMETLSGSLGIAARRFVDYWSGAQTWDRLGKDHQRTIAERMPKVQAEFEALFADRVPVAAYRQLTMPVRLLGGTRSPLPARKVLDILEANLPNVSRVTLPGLGHMGPVEDPQRVLEASGLLETEVLAEAA